MAERAHALLSASSAHRWLNCTPSARLEEHEPDVTSEAAEEGTEAHTLAELYARREVGHITQGQFRYRRDKFIEGAKYYTEEMDEACKAYGELIKSKVQGGDVSIVLFEHQVDYSNVAQDGFGTSDAIIIDQGELTIIDFKYGKGVLVDAEDNAQLRLYALGALAELGFLYDIERVNMAIFQPRRQDTPSEASMLASELKAWGDEYVKPRAEKAYQGTGDFAVSEDNCRFCKVRGKCPAQAEHYIALFEDNKELDTLSPQELGALLEKAQGLKQWLTELEERATEALYSGEDVTGFKLVEGRSSRRYTDEDAIIAVLMEQDDLELDDYIESKLVGISKLEKTLGKKRVGDLLSAYIEKPQGKPTLAHSKDKREAIQPQAQIIKMFNEEDN